MIRRGIRGGNTRVYYNEYYRKDGMQCWYLDINSMYAWAMTQHLPVGEFKYVDNVTFQDILEASDDADYGFFVELDIAVKNKPEIHRFLENYAPFFVKDFPLLSPKMKYVKFERAMKSLTPEALEKQYK